MSKGDSRALLARRPTDPPPRRGQRAPPLSFTEFEQQLKKESADELIRFWASADKHSALASSAPADQRDRAAELAKTMVDTFIKPQAPEEINISYNDREDILKNSETEEGRVRPTLFLRAKREVSTMLVGGPFLRFVGAALTTNITAKEVNNRWVASVVLALLSALIVGLFMYAQVVTGGTSSVLNTRWWRLLSAPSVFWSTGMAFSARDKV